jgi:hypothetical protein
VRGLKGRELVGEKEFLLFVKSLREEIEGRDEEKSDGGACECNCNCKCDIFAATFLLLCFKV